MKPNWTILAVLLTLVLACGLALGEEKGANKGDVKTEKSIEEMDGKELFKMTCKACHGPGRRCRGVHPHVLHHGTVGRIL
jgi:cytochrome c5